MTSGLRTVASRLDAEDELAWYLNGFIAAPGVSAYLDGNSLGRPLRANWERFVEFTSGPWGTRLIRSWDEEWLQLPFEVGDRIGSLIGAAPGQCVVADSTTVLLYKLAAAALSACDDPGRDEILLDSDNFPTDRYVLEGLAEDRGLQLRFIEPEFDAGVTVEQVRAQVSERTALALFSSVAYRSGYLADMAAISSAVHEAGAVIGWDLSHSVGVVKTELDSAGADFAVGCTYKYLNGGPGSPAFGYLASRHHDRWQQPIWGWMGRRDPFTMGPGYQPADGLRSLLSGTPPILAMLPLIVSLDLIEMAGLPAIRSKSLALTDFVLSCVDELLVPHGVAVRSPREASRRGGHITVQRKGFREINGRLWECGVICDYREPQCLRLGPSPLSTTFGEVLTAVEAIAEELVDYR